MDEKLVSLFDWMLENKLQPACLLVPRLDQPPLFRFMIRNCAVINDLAYSDCVTESTAPQEAIDDMATMLSGHEVIVYRDLHKEVIQAPTLYAPC